MKAAGITTWFQFTQGQCLFCHQGQRRMVETILPFSETILPLILLLFCLSLEKRLYLIACECSCILCPNFENFCPNNGQFLSVGDATASPCHTLMILNVMKELFKIISNWTVGFWEENAPLEIIIISSQVTAKYKRRENCFR